MKKLLTVLCLFLSLAGLMAQNNNVGIGTTNPDPSAALEIRSTDQGLLIPRMDSSARKAILNPAQGLLVFDNSNNSFWYFNGAAWQELAHQQNLTGLLDGEEIVLVPEGGDTLKINLSGLVNDADADPTNEFQNLALSGDTLKIINGNSILLPASAANTDEQNLLLSGDTLSIENGNFVLLPSGIVDTDDQTLSINGDTLSIADGNSIVLPAAANLFVNTAGLVRPDSNLVDLSSANFVFGSPQLDYDGNSDHSARMFFDKSKSAFRAGSAYSAVWDSDSIGFHSVAMGEVTTASGFAATALGNASTAMGSVSTAMGLGTIASGLAATSMGRTTTASGEYSTSMGINTVASGNNSTAMGSGTTSFGLTSTAMGRNTTASGTSSTAMGSSTAASGNFSTAMGVSSFAPGNGSTAMGNTTTASGSNSTATGWNTLARSAGEFAAGMFNTNYTPNSTSTWEAEDRLFTVGNGTSGSALSDAMVILKNGNTGFGTSTPNTTFHLVGKMKYEDGTQADGRVLTSDADGNATWEAASSATVALVFDTLGGVVVPGSAVDAATDDFVFGSPQLDYDTNSEHYARLFFDKSKGAFRVGSVNGTQWNSANLGDFSLAAGLNTKASGYNSTATGNVTEATGAYSTAMGHNTFASGDHSTAIGHNTIASGDYSTALGYSTEASGNKSIAMGDNTTASAGRTTTMGWSTTASGNNSTAMGNSTISSGVNATAMGYNTEATGQSSTAIGNNTTASGVNSIAMGNDSESQGDNSIAMGSSTSANGENSTAMGEFSGAIGQASTAMGNSTLAIGLYSTAMGSNTNAPSAVETSIGSYNTDYTPISSTVWKTADRLFTVGNGTISDRSDAMVILKSGNTGLGTSTPDTTFHLVGKMKYDDGTQADGYVLTSDADGNASWQAASGGSIFTNINNVVLADNSQVNYANDDFVFGSPQLNHDGTSSHYSRFFFDKNKGAFRAGRATNGSWDTDSIGNYSIAMGNNTIASAFFAIALGNGTKASSGSSLATGKNTVASGDVSTAMGEATTASGDYSTAMGYDAVASGSVSKAMGYAATASGSNSSAMGNSTTASGYSSTAMGDGTTAGGHYSTAMGSNTSAPGLYSTAMGYSTTASGSNSTAMGNFTGAPSAFETSIGCYSTLYTPNSATVWNAADRLFIVGNGRNNLNPSDALVILKSGNTGFGTSTPDTTFHLVGKMKYEDGTQADGYVLTSDADGNASWEQIQSFTTDTLSIISDADGDTKVQVEKTPNQNIIHFELAGNEYFTMRPNKLQILTPNAAQPSLDFIGSGTNSISNFFPGLSAPPAPASSYLMNFSVKGNNTLTLQGDGGVKINNAYTLPTTDGDSAQVLTTDGSGNVSWQPVPNVIKATVNIDLPSFGNTVEKDVETVSVPGAQVGATVQVSPSGGLVGNCAIGYAWVSSANTVTIVFYNHNTTNNDNPAMDFFVTVIN